MQYWHMRGWKRFKRSGWFGLLWLASYGFALGQSAGPAESVLRTGTWLKIGVTESGVYQIDQATLARLSPALASADPRLLRLYGNGGGMLPQANNSLRVSDLTENAILVNGETDGRLDPGDALVFFGQSPHVIQYDSIARRYTHQTNVYSDTTFYFLTVGTTAGRRVIDQAAGATAATPTVTTFTDYQFHELDTQKLPSLAPNPSLQSGREWLGEFMSLDTTLTITFDTPGLVAGSSVRMRLGAVAGARSPSQFATLINGQLVGRLPIPTISGAPYDFQAISRTDTFRLAAAGAGSSVRTTVTFQANGQQGAQGYLDYLGVELKRSLLQTDRFLWVRGLPAGLAAVGSANTALRIWNVTNPLVPAGQAYNLVTSEARWQASRPGDYVLFTDAQLRTPVSIHTVANQNLRAQPTPTLLIVTPAAWQSEADRLAAFRRANDGLDVLVVTTQQVYNEFGSGQPDPTAIRDAVRYYYRKEPGRLQYVLLMGDATFDYRNIKKLLSAGELANTVPVYESRESLHTIFSYSSDDYFGFMGDSEGEWPETDYGDYKLALGIGRLPVKRIDEARAVVDKLIRYATDRTLPGDWQTKVMLIADDGDFNTHMADANELATQIEAQSPAYRPERAFMDAYPQDVTANGQKSPTMNRLINQAVQDGRLIINYNGHGGVSGLADEQIVTDQDIVNWRNRRMPLFLTATCQFGRYDDPSVNSGAELALLNQQGGAIGLITTTRPVYANTNKPVNQAFYESVFTPINGRMPRLGDVMRFTKNRSLQGQINRNFALLGDPSMQLAYPQAQIILTQINKRPVSASRIDTLRALQPVELVGEVQQQQQRLGTFSGTLRLVLYDKAVTQTTLGTESAKMSYQTFANPLYAGQVAVQNGTFVARFTMPKDIDYSRIGPGRLYAYAIRTDSSLQALGSYEAIRIGGSVVPDTVDTTPPTVQISVVGGIPEGDQVRVAGPDISVRIRLRDNQGITIARSALGHELTAQLSGQTPVILNDLYVATGTNGQEGEVQYTFRAVATGRYSLRVKAWDLSNNSGEGALGLIVSEKPALQLQAIQVTPNPITTPAVLTASHNRTGESLDWELGIYDLTGRLMHRQTGACSTCSESVAVGSWDGTTDAGSVATNGLYVYRLQLHAVSDGSVVSQGGRLVLLR
ncbi:type IX secretion system sortase PorU [Spirosoma luteolum]